MTRINAYLGIGKEGRLLGMNVGYSSDYNYLFPGIIIAATGRSGETGAYTTASVRYTIKAALKESSSMVTIPNQVPSVRLWPDDHEIDADKLIGTYVVGFSIGNRIFWLFYEPPIIAGCVTPPIQPLIDSIIPGTIGTPIDGDGGTASAPTPTAPPGGEI